MKQNIRKQIGVVTCDVVLKGVKDGNNFLDTYHLKTCSKLSE